MRVSNLDVFVDELIDSAPSIILVDLGSNDMARVNADEPHRTALALVQFMEKIQRVIHCEVVFIEQFYRVCDNDFLVNSRIRNFNRCLFHLSFNMRGMTFFRHSNMWSNWRSFLLSDGVHLNSNGHRRYRRSYRGALLQASERLTPRYFH